MSKFKASNERQELIKCLQTMLSYAEGNFSHLTQEEELKEISFWNKYNTSLAIEREKELYKKSK